MARNDTLFTGSIPANYDRYMVPLLFRPYAEQVAKRASALRPQRILETAAGTGVVTEALHEALPEAEIVATDLNTPMLEEAGQRIGREKVRFQQADALALPFEDSSFDLVVCQFGVMFFPDKVAGNSEAHRVLRDGGSYMLVIWNSVHQNLATKVVGQAVADLFPAEDRSAFYERVPFRYFDQAIIRADLEAARFSTIEFETVELRSRAASARDAAMGLVQSTPMRTELEERGPGMLERATEAAIEALRQFEDPGGFDAPMSALIVTAAK
ncbi:MAG TPA: class I SAM-dependent methyltransferase [Sphingomicrobium sp.]|nr:class I SAM-dependent methyltransferase [Sphingomicrobium sp.]